MKERWTSLVLIAVMTATVSGYAAEQKAQRTSRAQEGREFPVCEKHRAQFMEQRQTRESRNKEFRESLKDKSPAERQAAMQKRAKSQYDEEISRINAGHQDRITRAKKSMQADRNLTQDQKKEKLASLQKQHQARQARAKERHELQMKMINASPEERGQLRQKTQERSKAQAAERSSKRGHAHGKDGSFCVICAKEAREAERSKQK